MVLRVGNIYSPHVPSPHLTRKRPPPTIQTKGHATPLDLWQSIARLSAVITQWWSRANLQWRPPVRVLRALALNDTLGDEYRNGTQRRATRRGPRMCTGRLLCVSRSKVAS